jgi:Tfp pilus tip-associated adhesin PilY1
LAFRVDVIYVGSVSCTDGGGLASPCIGAGPMWSGAMWRLTTNGDPEPNNWGVSGGPTKLVSTFAKDCLDTTATCAKTVGPILAAPAMAMDDSLTFRIFFGTGRYFTASDKGNDDPQYFFGVKDCDLTNGCTDLNHERHNLFDVSNVKICKLCNISDPSKIVSLNGDGTYDKGFDSGPDSLLNTVGPYDGWFTALQSPRERSLTTPVLIGGSLFFTTFSPGDDICGTTADGHLYSLYYLTGTPYKESTIGTDHNGVANKSIDLGEGVPSGVAIQIGAQGLGDSGMASNTGCVGSLTGFTQSSTGAINQLCGSPALHPWSRILSWRDV